MEKNILIISKDTLRKRALGCHGGKQWKTKNIDELAEKGTVFQRHYTAAASSSMSYTSMFTGKYTHELDRKKYVEVNDFQGETLFRTLEERGYACHIIWGKSWFTNVVPFTKIYGKKTRFHNLEIEQKVGVEKIGKIENEEIINQTLSKIVEEVLSIKEDKLFLWVHFPHVLYGKSCYDSDIEIFDQFVGEMRNHFNDNSIYITSDHGHMNMEKGIPVYGFHVYEGTINVPLITPKIDSHENIDFPTSHTQLMEIILENKISQRDFVFVDSQYYMQENRKLAIIKNNFKYIYNKKSRCEELYDLEVDPNENVNLLQKRVEDKGRGRVYWLDEIYYYAKWEEVETVYHELKAARDKIWRNGSYWEELFYKLNSKHKYLLSKLFGKRYIGDSKGVSNSKPLVINYQQ